MVGDQIGRDVRIMGEIQNALGLTYYKQGKYVQAFQYFEKAMEVFWREANLAQIQVEFCQSMITQCENKIMGMCGER